jgi:hypothetical protein
MLRQDAPDRTLKLKGITGRNSIEKVENAKGHVIRNPWRYSSEFSREQ